MLLLTPAPHSPPKDDAVLCAHCASLVPVGLRASSGDSFCCAGCEAVFGILKEVGLDDYYEHRARSGVSGQPVAAPAGEWSEFDGAEYAALYCRIGEDGVGTTELGLTGMHCAACIWLIERVGRVEPAVISSRVDFARGRVEIVWDTRRASLGRVAASLAGLGYRPHAPRGWSREVARRSELRGLLLRMGIAGAVAGNVMLMAFALYSGGADSVLMDATTRRFFEWGSWAISCVSLGAGSLFFRGALSALRTRTAHMDLPIALGISAAFVGGTLSTFRGHGPIYFDSITMLVFLLLIGRYLQRRHQLSAAEASELLHSVTPAWTFVVRDELQGSAPESTENIERIAADEVQPGDLVVVASGDVVPVDGKVERGSSSLDLCLLTGESKPLRVAPGDVALAGALNVGGRLWIRSEKAGRETRVASLMKEVERALDSRTPLVTEANRVAAVFTWVVVILAMVTFGGWFWVRPEVALDHALALLIVACPCALAMATPLALSAAARQAAADKILLFDARSVERLARPLDLVLDKTGTLTEGKLSCSIREGEAAVWRAVAELESVSLHPVAVAIREAVQRRFGASDSSSELLEVREIPGRGVIGRWQGRVLAAGSESFVRERGASVAKFEREGASGSPLWVVWGDQVVGAARVHDALREGVAENLLALRRAGHELSIESGDHPEVVRALVEQLQERTGRDDLFRSARGGSLPETKLAFVEQRVEAARRENLGRQVVMVGDGVNDAAALARADVGVAVRGAAEASRLSADVYLARGGVGDLMQLIDGARRTLRVIRRGMLFSLLYNAVGISLAMAGLLHPLLAAISMPLSSLTVVTNAFRSRTFRRRHARASSVNVPVLLSRDVRVEERA